VNYPQKHLINMADKQWCLNMAIEIAKEHARGGAERSPSIVLENVYTKLKELEEDAAS